MTQNQSNSWSFTMLPENDSSGEAVSGGQMGTASTAAGALYHYGIVPEMSVGAPKTQRPEPTVTPPSVTQPIPQPQPYSQQATQLPSAQPTVSPPASPIQTKETITSQVQTKAHNVRMVTVPVKPIVPTATLSTSAPPPPAEDTLKHTDLLLPTWLPQAIPQPAVEAPQSSPTTLVTNTSISGAERNETKKDKQLPSTLGAHILEEDEVRPAIVQIMSWVGMVIASVLLGVMVIDIGVLWTIEEVLGRNLAKPVVGMFLRAYPTYPLHLTFLGAVLAALIYMSVQLRDGSRRSLLMTVLTLGLGALGLYGLTTWNMQPLEGLLQNPQLIHGSDLLTSLQLTSINTFVLVVVGAMGVMALALLGMMGAFKYPSIGLRGVKAVGVVGLCGLIFLGGVAPTVFSVVASVQKDNGYTEARNAAGFRVYRPIDVPQGWVQVDQFHVNEEAGSLLVGRNDFVQVGFDTTLHTRIGGASSQLITVRQIDVTPGFDVAGFAQNVIDEAAVEQLSVQRAVERKGYAIEKNEAGTMVRALTFTTADNVLVLLSSKQATLNALVDLANAMD